MKSAFVHMPKKVTGSPHLDGRGRGNSRSPAAQWTVAPVAAPTLPLQDVTEARWATLDFSKFKWPTREPIRM